MVQFSKKSKKQKRKPYCFVLALLVVLFAARAEAQTVQQDLIGLGMKSELADYLAGIIPAGAALDNAVFLQGDNQAGSATINLIGTDTGDNTIINSSASDDLILRLEDDANRVITFDASSDTVLSMRFGDGGTTALQVFTIGGSTSDADDDGRLYLSGAGGGDNSRGSYIALDGNEATSAGDLEFSTGNASGSNALLRLAHAASTYEIRNSTGSAIGIFDATEGLTMSAGKFINSTAYVPTAAATPVLGTNQVLPGVNIVPTAAADTAMWLGASTPVPGQMFKIYNNAGNAVRIKGAGAALINGGTAGKYIAMAASSYMECLTLTTGIQQCPFYSVNGAVAAVPTPA